MPSCNTYHLTWVSLTLGVGYLFMAAPAKDSHCSLTLDEGYLLTAALPDLQRGIAPLGPPAPGQPLLLGREVAHLGCSAPSQPGTLSRCPRPRMWGNFSWPPPFGHGVFPASAPDLGRGVAPLGALGAPVAATRAVANSNIKMV